jgi:hypothetical protein
MLEENTSGKKRLCHQKDLNLAQVGPGVLIICTPCHLGVSFLQLPLSSAAVDVYESFISSVTIVFCSC